MEAGLRCEDDVGVIVVKCGFGLSENRKIVVAGHFYEKRSWRIQEKTDLASLGIDMETER